MSKVKHLLGISGGKDSAALALYLQSNYPELDTEYYTCDTGKELTETYELIGRLESALGKEVVRYHSFDETKVAIDNPFDHFLASYGHFLPSSGQRWCTQKMKLEPFEKNVGDEPTISYVGIRGDENREGYISKRENIQTIFPFRKNIWSSDVIKTAFSKQHLGTLREALKNQFDPTESEAALKIFDTPLSLTFTLNHKVESLLDFNTPAFNHAIHNVLKNTDYPVGKLDNYPLLDNQEILGIDDIFKLLEESGVGIPAYYLPVEFTADVDGEIKTGTYSRSRSGCFFCFFQQKIEWVWLLEQHPDLFAKAVEYEKDGYTWAEEPLTELMKPERVNQIKSNYIKKTERAAKNAKNQLNWKDEILNAEGIGCSSCFI